MKKYVLGSFVENDLDIIWEYIARDDIEAADRLTAKFFNSFQTLANTPGMGRFRKDLTNLPVLFWPIGSYIILYTVENDQVQVIAIAHGARDIPSFLKRRTDRTFIEQ